MSTSHLNIAIVSDAVLPFNKGGKETRIYFLANELARQGNSVHIYTMKWWEGNDSLRIEGVYYHAISKLYSMYTKDRRSIKQGFLFGLACLRLFGKKFDVVDVDHMPFFPLYSVWLVCLLRRKPMYATWHEVWGRAYWVEYMGMGGHLASAIERLSIYLPEKIIASSAPTGSRLREVLRYSGELWVIPPVVDSESIESIKVSDQKSDVIFVGRLVEHKNVDMLVKAIGILKEIVPNICCVLVGDGPELGRLSDLIGDLGLESNILMVGRLEDSEEVISLMKASKVFALPSTREGFGIVVLEAGACHLQVVTVDHKDNGARHLVAPGNGLLCNPTPEDLALAIQSLLEAGPPMTSSALAGETWPKVARRLTEAYGK